MANLESAALYTVPSTWVSPYTNPLSTPYRRVVGIEHAGGMPAASWSRIDPTRDVSAYKRRDAEREGIEMPTLALRRLVGFFNRYFVEDPRVKPVYDKKTGHQVDVSTEGINCHRFGYWMRGSIVADRHEVPEAPDHIVAEGVVVERSLPSGKHGVYGSRSDYFLSGSALHSVVGLGEEQEECLQVLASGGFLGVDSYEHVLDFYDPDRDAKVKLYTL